MAFVSIRIYHRIGSGSGRATCRWRGEHISWFVLHQQGRQRLFATREVETEVPVELYKRDVTADISVEGDDVATIAFARDDGVVVLLANRAEHTTTVAVRREGVLRGHALRRVFESLNGGWREDLKGESDAFATAIARNHYALLDFVKES